MTYNAKIICDSVSYGGVRLTTMEVVMPRIVLAEFNTHRMFSRCSASSRAIPVAKMLQRVMDTPYVPHEFGKNKRGMQSDENLKDDTHNKARDAWLKARGAALQYASELAELGVHKQLANRILEPFLWHTVIVSATDWDNFFHLRCHKDAHPGIRIPAEMMREVYAVNSPALVRDGGYHMPYVTDEDWEDARSQVHLFTRGDDEECAAGKLLAKVSIARCARVSYLTHDGTRDLEVDLDLYDKLVANGHMSPLEHVATPNHGGPNNYVGNFRGWTQFRKSIAGEDDMLQ